VFMEGALNAYEDDASVYHISGYAYDVPEFRSIDEAIVLSLTSTWGWATWKRSWEKFDREMKAWDSVEHTDTLLRAFNLEGAYDYGSMVKRQKLGKIDSWGIRWYLSVFQNKGKCIFPPRSLVFNAGFDGEGTHGKGFLKKRNLRPEDNRFRDYKFPPAQIHSEQVALVYKAIYRENGGWLGKLLEYAKKLLGR